MKKMLLVFTVLAAVALTGPAALALAPMGTPTAEVKAGQFLLGGDYAWARTDVKAEDSSGHISTHTFLAKAGYGFCDEWEGYVRLGLGNVRAEDFDGKFRLAGGFGTKYTFYKSGDLDWGALYQMTWLYSRREVDDVTVRMKPWDAQIAVGPTYKFSNEVSFYGGPYLEFMRGKITAEGETARINNLLFGLYVGSQVMLSECTSIYGELQFAGHNSWGLGTGIAWRF